MSILENIGAGIVSVAIAIAGFFGYTPEPAYAPVEEALGADTQTFFGGQAYTLAGTGISSSASSFTLTSFTISQNGKKIQDSEMSDTFYGTFEPGSRARQEFFSCTTVTQNSDGTATISGCTRGLSPVAPYTASTSLQFPHGGGTSVIFSNTPQFYDQFAAKGNDETITGQWTFLNFPITASSSPATATTTGTVELATGGEAASSTLSGDIVASRLALHTGIATSAAPTSGNVVVVTGDDGNIDAGFCCGGNATVTFNGYVDGISSSTIRSTTTSGIYTKPVGLRHLIVELQGSGGDGATDGAGGGAGGYAKRIIRASELSSTTTVTVGTAGQGTGVTSFGTFSVGNGADAVGTTGGVGGTATSGEITINGQSGASSVSSLGGGQGGDSVLGGPGQYTYNSLATSVLSGSNASGYGAGGAGGQQASDSSPTGGTGGQGTVGIVIITEVF